MWNRISGKSNDAKDVIPQQNGRRKDDGDRSKRSSSGSMISSKNNSSTPVLKSDDLPLKPSKKSSSRGDDRDRGFNPTSSSYSSTTQSAYPGAASASVATASGNHNDQPYTPAGLIRNASLANQMPKSQSSRDGRIGERDSDLRSELRKKRAGKETERDQDHHRQERKDTRDKGRAKSSNTASKNAKGCDSGERIETSRGPADFPDQVGVPGFSQFPGQYDGGVPHHNGDPIDHPMSSHVQDQFPGQFPVQSTAPYRPPIAISEGGPGLAAEYYGDAGESVAEQPGNRTNTPTLIIGAEPHLQPALAVAAPPPEPSALGGVGAAASFFSGDFDDDEVATSHGQQTSSTYTTAHVRPDSSHHSSSAPAIPTFGGAAMGAAAGYLIGNQTSSHASRPDPVASTGVVLGGSSSASHQYPPPPKVESFYSNGPQPSRPTEHSSQSSNVPMYAAGAAALASSAYHQSHHPSSHHSSIRPQYSTTSTAQRHRHHGPLEAIVDFFKDPDAVAQFEEYSEIIGVCRYCFAPGSSPRDAPRRHHYRKKRSNEGLGRVDKDSRYHSSENESRRKKKDQSWLATGLAGYGLAKVGESLFKQKNDFVDTYSMRTGRHSPEESGYTSRHRKRSRDRIETGITGDGKVYKKFSQGGFSDGSKTAVFESLRRSRSNSRSRKRKNSIAKETLGAITGSAVSVSSSRRRRSPSVTGAFVRTRHRKGEHSPELHRRSQKKKKARGFFSIGSLPSSSSSSSVDLAQDSDKKHNIKRKTARSKDDKRAEAALLGLGVAAAALASKDGRDSHKRKGAKQPKGVKEAGKKHSHDPKSDNGPEEEVWESALEDEYESADSGLAYGAPKRRGSRESLSSQSSGTEKWDWRWGSRKRRDSPSERKYSNHITSPTVAGAASVGSDGAAVISLDQFQGTGMDSTSSLPLQQVFPVPTSDPTRFEVGRELSITSSGRPGAIPIQHPQPVMPISATIYSTQAPYEHSYSAPTGLPVLPHPDHHPQFTAVDAGFAKSKADISGRLAQDVPEVKEADPESKVRRRDSSPARFGAEAVSSSTAPRRRSSVKDDISTVRFERTVEQEEDDRRERRRKRKEERERREAKEQDRIDGGRNSSRIEPNRISGSETRREGSPERSFASSWSVPAAAGLIGAAIGSAAAAERSKSEESREERRERRRREREREEAEDEEAARRRARRQKERKREREHINDSDARTESQGIPTEITESADETKRQTQTVDSGKKSIWQEAATPKRSSSHENYGDFFRPLDLSDGSVKITNRNVDADVDFDQTPAIVTVVPKGFRDPDTQPTFSPADTNERIDTSDLSFPVPKFRLVKPTPPSSRASTPTLHHRDIPDEAVEELVQKRSPSKVTWGDDQTYEYAAITVDGEREEAVDPSLGEISDHDLADTPVPSHEWTLPVDQERENEDVTDLRSELNPPSYGDDIGFAATLAASAEDAGFDPSIVIDNPEYRRRDSPPGSDDHSVLKKFDEDDDSTLSRKEKRRDRAAKHQVQEDGSNARDDSPVVQDNISQMENQDSPLKDNPVDGFGSDQKCSKNSKSKKSSKSGSGSKEEFFEASESASHYHEPEVNEVYQASSDPSIVPNASISDSREGLEKLPDISPRDDADFKDSVSGVNSSSHVSGSDECRPESNDKPKGSMWDRVLGRSRDGLALESPTMESTNEATADDFKQPKKKGKKSKGRRSTGAEFHDGQATNDSRSMSITSGTSSAEGAAGISGRMTQGLSAKVLAPASIDSTQPNDVLTTSKDRESNDAQAPKAEPEFYEVVNLSELEHEDVKRPESFLDMRPEPPPPPDTFVEEIRPPDPFEPSNRPGSSPAPPEYRRRQSWEAPTVEPLASPTAVPFDFRFSRPRPLIGSGRSMSQTRLPMQSPTGQFPRPKPRPRSTEFSSSKEFRPLVLVERHRSHQDSAPEETYPSPPSSHTTSRSSSVRDAKEDARARYEMPTSSLEHMEPGHGLAIHPDHPIAEPDLLGSQQATPTASSFQYSTANQNPTSPRGSRNSSPSRLEDEATPTLKLSDMALGTILAGATALTSHRMTQAVELPQEEQEQFERGLEEMAPVEKSNQISKDNSTPEEGPPTQRDVALPQDGLAQGSPIQQVSEELSSNTEPSQTQGGEGLTREGLRLQAESVPFGQSFPHEAIEEDLKDTIAEEDAIRTSEESAMPDEALGYLNDFAPQQATKKGKKGKRKADRPEPVQDRFAPPNLEGTTKKDGSPPGTMSPEQSRQLQEQDAQDAVDSWFSPAAPTKNGKVKERKGVGQQSPDRIEATEKAMVIPKDVFEPADRTGAADVGYLERAMPSDQPTEIIISAAQGSDKAEEDGPQSAMLPDRESIDNQLERKQSKSKSRKGKKGRKATPQADDLQPTSQTARKISLRDSYPGQPTESQVNSPVALDTATSKGGADYVQQVETGLSLGPELSPSATPLPMDDDLDLLDELTSKTQADIEAVQEKFQAQNSPEILEQPLEESTESMSKPNKVDEALAYLSEEKVEEARQQEHSSSGPDSNAELAEKSSSLQDESSAATYEKVPGHTDQPDKDAQLECEAADDDWAGYSSTKKAKKGKKGKGGKGSNFVTETSSGSGAKYTSPIAATEKLEDQTLVSFEDDRLDAPKLDADDQADDDATQTIITTSPNELAGADNDLAESDSNKGSEQNKTIKESSCGETSPSGHTESPLPIATPQVVADEDTGGIASKDVTSVQDEPEKIDGEWAGFGSKKKAKKGKRATPEFKKSIERATEAETGTSLSASSRGVHDGGQPPDIADTPDANIPQDEPTVAEDEWADLSTKRKGKKDKMRKSKTLDLATGASDTEKPEVQPKAAKTDLAEEPIILDEVEPKPLELKTVEPHSVIAGLVERKSVAPGSLQLKSVNQDSFISGLVEPNSIEPESVPPQPGMPKLEEPEFVEPQSLQPNSIEPESVVPLAVTSELIQPESVDPTSAKPEYMTPETLKPNSIEQGSAVSELLETKSPISESVEPQPLMPELIQPEAVEVESEPIELESIGPKSMEQVQVEPEVVESEFEPELGTFSNELPKEINKEGPESASCCATTTTLQEVATILEAEKAQPSLDHAHHEPLSEVPNANVHWPEPINDQGLRDGEQISPKDERFTQSINDFGSQEMELIGQYDDSNDPNKTRVLGGGAASPLIEGIPSQGLDLIDRYEKDRGIHPNVDPSAAVTDTAKDPQHLLGETDTVEVFDQRENPTPTPPIPEPSVDEQHRDAGFGKNVLQDREGSADGLDRGPSVLGSESAGKSPTEHIGGPAQDEESFNERDGDEISKGRDSALGEAEAREHVQPSTSFEPVTSTDQDSATGDVDELSTQTAKEESQTRKQDFTEAVIDDQPGSELDRQGCEALPNADLKNKDVRAQDESPSAEKANIPHLSEIQDLKAFPAPEPGPFSEAAERSREGQPETVQESQPKKNKKDKKKAKKGKALVWEGESGPGSNDKSFQGTETLQTGGFEDPTVLDSNAVDEPTRTDDNLPKNKKERKKAKRAQSLPWDSINPPASDPYFLLDQQPDKTQTEDSRDAEPGMLEKVTTADDHSEFPLLDPPGHHEELMPASVQGSTDSAQTLLELTPTAAEELQVKEAETTKAKHYTSSKKKSEKDRKKGKQPRMLVPDDSDTPKEPEQSVEASTAKDTQDESSTAPLSKERPVPSTEEQLNEGLESPEIKHGGSLSTTKRELGEKSTDATFLATEDDADQAIEAGLDDFAPVKKSKKGRKSKKEKSSTIEKVKDPASAGPIPVPVLATGLSGSDETGSEEQTREASRAGQGTPSLQEASDDPVTVENESLEPSQIAEIKETSNTPPANELWDKSAKKSRKSKKNRKGQPRPQDDSQSLQSALSEASQVAGDAQELVPGTDFGGDDEAIKARSTEVPLGTPETDLLDPSAQRKYDLKYAQELEKFGVESPRSSTAELPVAAPHDEAFEQQGRSGQSHGDVDHSQQQGSEIVQSPKADLIIQPSEAGVRDPRGEHGQEPDRSEGSELPHADFPPSRIPDITAQAAEYELPESHEKFDHGQEKDEVYGDEEQERPRSRTKDLSTPKTDVDLLDVQEQQEYDNEYAKELERQLDSLQEAEHRDIATDEEASRSTSQPSLDSTVGMPFEQRTQLAKPPSLEDIVEESRSRSGSAQEILSDRGDESSPFKAPKKGKKGRKNRKQQQPIIWEDDTATPPFESRTDHVMEVPAALPVATGSEDTEDAYPPANLEEPIEHRPVEKESSAASVIDDREKSSTAVDDYFTFQPDKVAEEDVGNDPEHEDFRRSLSTELAKSSQEPLPMMGESKAGEKISTESMDYSYPSEGLSTPTIDNADNEFSYATSKRGKKGKKSIRKDPKTATNPSTMAHGSFIERSEPSETLEREPIAERSLSQKQSLSQTLHLEDDLSPRWEEQPVDDSESKGTEGLTAAAGLGAAATALDLFSQRDSKNGGKGKKGKKSKKAKWADLEDEPPSSQSPVTGDEAVIESAENGRTLGQESTVAGEQDHPSATPQYQVPTATYKSTPTEARTAIEEQTHQATPLRTPTPDTFEPTSTTESRVPGEEDQQTARLQSSSVPSETPKPTLIEESTITGEQEHRATSPQPHIPPATYEPTSIEESTITGEQHRQLLAQPSVPPAAFEPNSTEETTATGKQDHQITPPKSPGLSATHERTSMEEITSTGAQNHQTTAPQSPISHATYIPPPIEEGTVTEMESSQATLPQSQITYPTYDLSSTDSDLRHQDSQLESSNYRDSAINIFDSPVIPDEVSLHRPVRDSGYPETELSPTDTAEQDDHDAPVEKEDGTLLSGSSKQETKEHDEGFQTPGRGRPTGGQPSGPSAELDPSRGISVPKPMEGQRRSRSYDSNDSADSGFDIQRRRRHQAMSREAREPSPVSSTTKDRSSALFNSSPSARDDQPHEQYALASNDPIRQEPTWSFGRGNSENILEHSASDEPSLAHTSRPVYDPSTYSKLTSDQTEPPQSLFGVPVSHDEDVIPESRSPPTTETHGRGRRLRTISEDSQERLSLHAKGKRSISDVGSPEAGIKGRRVESSPASIHAGNFASPGHPLSHETGSSDDNGARLGDPERSKSRNTDRVPSRQSDLSKLPSILPKSGEGDHRTASAASIRSDNSIHAIIKTPDQVRSASGQSYRSSGTPPLRRVDRSASSDLRGASRLDKAKIRAKTSQAELDLDTNIASSSAYDPVTDKGKNRADMADIYEGWGDVRGQSPMSPTRPPSMRKRQSMQILDLESRLDQLVSENRLLHNQKSNAEKSLQDQTRDHSQQRHAYEEALQEHKMYLAQKDSEINELRGIVEEWQGKVDQLAEVNEALTSSRALNDKLLQNYKDLEDEHVHLKERHTDLATGMEALVQREVASHLEAKNAELQQLRTELESAKQQVRNLQQQLSATRQEEDFVERDEDYFDAQCQSLCQHVQQWVLRFSKFSDMKLCLRASEVRDETKVDRMENAILDGTDVDIYLQDRVKRRDIFMAVVMTMIFDYIFTRYLFGMDREQRQKLKNLEKTLQEIGPMSAVCKWRATTLTLLMKREDFARQRATDVEAIVHEIYDTLAAFLPPPSHLVQQIQDSLRKVINAAADLSIEMRTQRADYQMLPPLQPDYDLNGDLAQKVYFNALTMNERSGATTSNQALQEQGAVVRMVLFPLVVKNEEDDEQIVVCPAQVLTANSKGKKTVRVMSVQGSTQGGASQASFADVDMEGGMI